MKRNLFLILAAAAFAASACQKAPDSPPAASASPAQSSRPADSPSEAALAAAPKVEVCTLLSASEVGALMGGKKLVQDGCTYGLDTADQQKALADNQAQFDASSKKAAAGDLNGFMKGMMKAADGQQKTASVMMNQMSVTVEATRDGQTEEQIKAIYAQTGAAVRGAIAPVAPESRGVNGIIQGLDEVSGVGDWAFATNVAAVNMGLGFSSRGRILEARKGPWHVTVSANVSPDPGAAALDQQMAGVARALIAKL